jgi:N-acetylmuramoyl-L-alanine amidase
MALRETLIELADEEGFWAQTIWKHAENQDLRKRRKYLNVLAEGDVVYIPDKEEYKKDCATDQRHVFRRKGIPALFRLQVLVEGKPKSNLKYVLTIQGEDKYGVLDGEGTLEEHVPTNVQYGELLLEDGTMVQLEFGALEPADEITGVQNRLNNLGFSCGSAEPGVLDSRTRDALRQFQARNNLKQTGDLDEATRKKLEDIHDMTGAFPKEPPSGH